MGISVRDAERLSDEIYRDRRITGLTYCGKCGYCLKTLPYQYACPECGNEYNARATEMKGIFVPNQAAYPYGDLLATLVYAAIAFVLHWGAYANTDWVRIGMAWFMSGLCAINACVAFERFHKALRARDIIRRIVRQQEEE